MTFQEPRHGTRLEKRADGFFHRHLDVGAVTLHVAEARPAGQEEAVRDDTPLVVFLHGFPELWWSWRHQLRAFAGAGFWAVAPDLRGYNESDKPAGVASYELEKLSGDVAGLVHALGRKRAIVVGHDWGAVVAWNVAERYPELVERLGICNVPHPLAMARGLRTLRQLKKSWYIFFFQLSGISERAIAARDFERVREMFREDGIPNDDLEPYISALKMPGALTAMLSYYRAAVRRVLAGRPPEVKTVSCPVLVIWGDKDRALGKELADPPARFVPNARVVHIPDATHWVQNSAPEEVSRLLLEFAGPAREG
ncbi:MAG: Epoxide hydrolase [Labilithrix sp.]|nr:Epoxide hydrolase [Labilithrix sp.]